MDIKIICFGKMDANGYSLLEKNYLEKLKRFCRVDVVALKEETTPDLKKNQQKNEQNLERYWQEIPGVKILLDIAGVQYSSEAFADKIASFNVTANATITFFIGPSDGFSSEFRARFADKISFGKATLPHQLARIVMLEQIYRAFKIINHEKYHK
jgi:23S rRNA (pseudouridine1915-N3)-methyltransferase